MATYSQIGGIGWTDHYIPQPSDPNDLWPLLFRPPPAQNSLIVYDDGRVVEGRYFQNYQIEAPNVYAFLAGGRQNYVECGSQLAEWLIAAGYTLSCEPAEGVYPAVYAATY